MSTMNLPEPVGDLSLPLPLLHKGKVRNTYELGTDVGGNELLLMVATDRISAFDVVLPSLIPLKGDVLTQLSALWFTQTRHIVPNHFVALVTPHWLQSEFARTHGLSNMLEPVIGRAMVVKKTERIDVECIVRGYLAGSAWAEYQKDGTVWGEKLPPGLREGEQLPSPRFTPTTKAEQGHDKPLSHEAFIALVGDHSLALQIEAASLFLYAYARSYARERGLIVADTKMEFGLLGGEPILIDELLTPDSSRFWDASEYAPGKPIPSFDKQFVRDWLTAQGWNKEPPAPELPPDIIEQTSYRYLQVLGILTGP